MADFNLCPRIKLGPNNYDDEKEKHGPTGRWRSCKGETGRLLELDVCVCVYYVFALFLVLFDFAERDCTNILSFTSAKPLPLRWLKPIYTRLHTQTYTKNTSQQESVQTKDPLE